MGSAAREDYLDEATIFHVTHYKAGSRWIHRILKRCVGPRLVTVSANREELLEAPIEPGRVYSACYATYDELAELHVPADTHRFFILRDLRDTLVSLTSRGGLVRKMPMPRLALPAAVLLSSGFVLLSNLAVAVVWMLATGVGPYWTWLLAPILIIWLVVICGSLGLLVSGAYVFVRDVGQIWPVIARITFYMTPLIYPIQVVRADILWKALSYNPLSPLFAQAQTWIVNPDQPGWFEAKGTGLAAFLPFLILAVIAVAGAVVFSKGARRAAERL
jgi:ABC-type polysaccharide/polyol phosphate export permease